MTRFPISRLREEFRKRRPKLRPSQYFVRSIGEGEEVPRFFLPTRREFMRHATEFWVFPLAIPVLLFYIARNVLYSIWNDLLDFSELNRENVVRLPEDKYDI